MSSDRPIAWLGKQKEKKALELSGDHIEQIVKTTKLMKKTVNSFYNNSDDVDENADRVFEAEKKADQVKSDVMEKLSQGNFPPINREKILRLITTADDIADNARAASIKLKFLDPEKVDKEVKEGLKKISIDAQEAVERLRDSYLTLLENPDKAVEKTEDVEEIEERIDAYRAENLNPEIVKWADESQKPGTSSMLKEIEGNIEEIADQAENCADSIREIAIGTK